MKDSPAWRLERNAFGRLELTAADGTRYVDVVPVRAFPITLPDAGLALVDAHGRELAWIERLSDLPGPTRELIAAELASREFMPVLSAIRSVSSFATPSRWQVETDHGETTLVLKGEEDIRRLAPPALMITDSNGIHYLIRDRRALDAHSRKILDRFL